METIRAITERKSIRNYQDKEVESGKVGVVVEAGRQAPNAGPIQITVIKDRGYLREINDQALAAMKESGNEFLMQRASLEGYKPLYGAPILILLSAPEGPYSKLNAACAATAMTIAATDQGLGSCFVITPTLALDGANKLSERLQLPEEYFPVCGVLLGYAGEQAFVTADSHADDNVNYI